jgi:Tfp pilus assembly protein PilF
LNRGQAALFCVGWYFIALLPVSGIYPIKAYLAEHWLYVPSLGVFSLVGLAFSSLAARPGGRRLVVAALVCLGVLFGALTARQNLYFRDPQTFYERTVRYNPSSARLLNNLGIIYYDQKRVEEARALFERAVAIDPEYPEGYNNLGHIYYREGKFPEAVALFQKAIRINPRSADAFNNLGVVACEQGNYQDGVRFFAKAAECNPFDPSTRYNLGLALARLGKTAEAEAALLEALKINPGMGNVHERLARLYAEGGDYRKAAFHAERAAALGCPTDQETQEKISQKAEVRRQK